MSRHVRLRQALRLSATVAATLVTGLGYAGAVIVEPIAGGIVTGAPAERRRERTIERLHDHFTICGSGRLALFLGDLFAPPEAVAG